MSSGCWTSVETRGQRTQHLQSRVEMVMRHLGLCSATWPSSRAGASGIARYSYCATCSEEENPDEQWVVEMRGAEWNCTLGVLGVEPIRWSPPPNQPTQVSRDTAF